MMWCVVVVRGRRSDERTVVIARCRFAESGGGCSDEVETHVSNSGATVPTIHQTQRILVFYEVTDDEKCSEIYYGIVWNFVLLSVRFTSLVAVRGSIVRCCNLH